MHTTYEWAQVYSGLGWSVIPVQPRSKIPMVSWTQYQFSRPSAQTLAAWFNHDCPVNIGVVTGKVSNIIVLDVDDPNAVQGKQLPPTPCSRSGGGGLHYFFKWPGFTVKNFTRKIPGVDLRGDGGFVVLPESFHASGNVYEWLIDPLDTPTADAPDWLLSVIEKGNNHQNSNIPFEPDIIPAGQRNAGLAAIAGALRKRGLSQEAITSALLAENKVKCRPSLPEGEVRLIAQSISRYVPEEPIGQPKVSVTPIEGGRGLVIVIYFSYGGDTEHE